jgi:hypothetical protein
LMLEPRTRTTLARSLWLASMGCCAGGLLAALLWIRPLMLGTLTGARPPRWPSPVGFAAARWRR